MDELRWYAVYTAPRAEKKVSERFTLEGIEHYLPIQTVKRRWSDRIKEVEVPVVSGYIFVHILFAESIRVTNIYGALSFVREGGKPVAIPEVQLTQLRFMVEHSEEPVEYTRESFEHGEQITIIKGPLTGITGELVEMKGKNKVLIRLERFGCAITTIPLSFVEKKQIVNND